MIIIAIFSPRCSSFDSDDLAPFVHVFFLLVFYKTYILKTDSQQLPIAANWNLNYPIKILYSLNRHFT